MSSQRRTFVLQAVSVAVVVGVIFLTFLRPSEVGELSGIDAPGGDGPGFTLPGDSDDETEGARKNSEKQASEPDPRESSRAGGAVTALGPGLDGVPAVPPAGRDPADDQYSSAAAALIDRVRDTDSEPAR